MKGCAQVRFFPRGRRTAGEARETGSAIGRRATAAKDDTGTTLIELVTAMAILLVVAMGTIGAFSFVATSSANSKEGVRALNLANQKLEEARNLPYDSVGLFYADGSYGDPAGMIPASQTVDEFTVQTTITWKRDTATGRSAYKNIRVDVSWTKPRVGNVTVASAIYGKSNLTNVGDLNINVQEEGTSVKIPGALVGVTPASGALHWVRSDDNADAFFGGLPIGAATLAVSSPDYVFDPLDQPTINIVADLLDSLVVYGVKPCSSVVTVIDTSSTPIPGATVTLTDSHGRQYVRITGADGLASFTGLYPDMYQVRADKVGRVGATGSIGPMSNGAAYPITLTMTLPVPPGSVRVRVSDGSGVYLSGVSVTLTGPYPASTVVTGSPQITPTSGEVFWANVDTDGSTKTYTATASKTGYTSTSVSGSVTNPNETIITVTLQVDVTPGALHIIIGTSAREYFSVTGPGGYNSGRLRTHSGTYDRTLSGLVPGAYTVTPENSHRYAAKQVQVTPGSPPAPATQVQW